MELMATKTGIKTAHAREKKVPQFTENLVVGVYCTIAKLRFPVERWIK